MSRRCDLFAQTYSRLFCDRWRTFFPIVQAFTKHKVQVTTWEWWPSLRVALSLFYARAVLKGAALIKYLENASLAKCEAKLLTGNLKDS
jgi:hypothetical protein